jgi:SAM-dependent methyltransferase
MKKLDDEFWSDQYKNNTIGWDVGGVSRPIKEYVEQLEDKSIAILIPGCGNAYEAEHLLAIGFSNVTLIDISEVLVEELRVKFAKEIGEGRCQLIHGNFFDIMKTYDLVLEQTFFCALDPSLRDAYVKKMAEIVKPGGKLAGLLFDMDKPDGPPFGGRFPEYELLFKPSFNFKTFEFCHNSIAPRAGNEYFIILVRKN